MTRLIAIRHGETDWNAQARIQGHLDIPLNANGAVQARRLARALAGEELAAVYSSDLARARQTAQPVVQQLGLPLRVEAGLRERSFGGFEGMTYREVEAQWPDEHRRWRERDPSFRPPAGESLESFYARCIATIERLCEAHRGAAIAVVAHGGVMDCLYRAATRVDLQAPRTWQLGNASINRVLHTPQGFSLVGWGDTLHLEDPARDESADAAVTGPAG